MRLVTPCCGAPLLPQPFACLHEWERHRFAVPPQSWLGHRPRRVQLALGLGVGG